MAEQGARRRRGGPLLVGAFATLALLLIVPVSASGSPYPPLPLGYGAQLVGNLSAPSLTPGASGTLAFTVTDPLSGPIAGVSLSLVVYAFNAFPGNATSTVPVSGAPILTTSTASGASVNVTIGTLGAHQTQSGSVGVETSTSTPVGTYAVRTALSFTLQSNGTAYRVASRGWFTAAAWATCTELPNGSVALNLSCLGVSGVSPETAVLVTSSDWDWVLSGLLAAAIVLAGAAAYVYFRRGPGSTSGAR